MNLKNFRSLLMVLLVVGPSLSSARPVAKKSSFGAGLLTGALAGVVAHKVMSSSSHKEEPKEAAPIPQATTVQNGPVFSNGCYEQTMREPDPSDSRKFTETVHLVCPPPTSPQFPPVIQPSPVAPQAPVYATPSFVMPEASPVAPANPPLAAQPQPVATPTIAQEAQTISATAPVAVPSIYPQLPPQMSPQPNLQSIPQMPAQTNPEPPRVFVISSKTGFYNNDAPTSGGHRLGTNVYWALVIATLVALRPWTA